MEKRSIIFYDGYCLLCSSLIKWIAAQQKEIYFTNIDSEFASKVLKKYYEETQNIDSIIFLHNGRFFYKSKAIFAILNKVGGFYKVANILKIIPTSLADNIYDWVAKNRYKWFRRKESCDWNDNKSLKKYIT